MAASKTTKPKSERPAPSVEVKQSIESNFLDYLRAVNRAYTDSQKRCEDIYQAYLREVGDTYRELQKRTEDLQRDYIADIQEAFGSDDASLRAKTGYDDAMSGYRRLVEDAQPQGEQMNKKLASLLAAQSEDLQKQFSDAFTTYLQGLQQTVQQLDGASVRLSDLEYLSQSIGTVAAYARATGAVPQSDPPAP